MSISENHRFFVSGDNEPFFWLGDTAWLLFSELSREKAEQYLDDRTSKGFNVIQVMVLHQLDNHNYYGDTALENSNIFNPLTTEGADFKNTVAYDFWDHVDYIIGMAEERGIWELLLVKRLMHLGIIPEMGNIAL